MNIAVIGLGHLGLPLAALLAAAGHRVIGVDRESRRVIEVERKETSWFEPGLAELLVTANLLQATDDIKSAVTSSDASVIVVPTPSDADGRYDCRYVVEVVVKIGAALRVHKRSHTIIIASTVMPGSLNGIVGTNLQEAANRRLGGDLGLCYCPNFGALGDILNAYRSPDFLLVGESDRLAGDIAVALYRSIMRSEQRVFRLNLIDAEVAKIALNTFIVTKISFANMLADLCAHVPGSNVENVVSVLGEDKRIGSRYFRAAMPFGGPCFGRDIDAFKAFAKGYGERTPLAEGVAEANENHIATLVDMLETAAPIGGIVAILGLAYRPNTDVVIASPSIGLANTLQVHGRRVQVWDPRALASAQAFLHSGVKVAESPAECLRDADVVLVANPDPSFAQIEPSVWAMNSKKPVVFDCWRILQAEQLSSYLNIQYIGVGTPAGTKR